MRSDRRALHEQAGRTEAQAIAREAELSIEARRLEAQAGALRFAQGAGRHGQKS
jgi:enoyl-CoA hydratase